MNRTQAEVEHLMEKHRYLVREIARKWHYDQDVEQCALIGLWRAAEEWDGVKPFPPFARVCIRNEVYSHLRKVVRWGTPVDPDSLPEAGVDGEERQISTLDTLEAIQTAFPPNSQERLVLSALLSGTSKCAIAAALGCDTYKITRIAKRAMEQLEKGGEP